MANNAAKRKSRPKSGSRNLSSQQSKRGTAKKAPSEKQLASPGETSAAKEGAASTKKAGAKKRHKPRSKARSKDSPARKRGTERKAGAATAKPKRAKALKTASGARINRPPLEGRVLPLTLGAPGLDLETRDGERYRTGAAVPGDVLRFFPWRSKNALAGGPGYADVDGLIRPAPARISPPCPLVEGCGGCSLQQMAYSSQLAAKTEALRAVLAPLGPASKTATIDGLDHAFGYRTKLVMPASGTPGALRFGFNRRHSLEVLPAEGCPVQHPLSLGILAMVRAVLDAHRIAPSESKGTRGWLHGVAIRVDPQSNTAEVVLSARSKIAPKQQALVEQLAGLPGVTTLGICVSPARSSFLLDGELLPLAGKKRSGIHLGGQYFELSLGSFFQTSYQGAELLVRRVGELLPKRIHTFADLYGGVGVFTRIFAERWQRALVVESSRAATYDLERHIEADKAKIKVLGGKVEDQMSGVARANPDVVLLDPPRRGCHPKVITALCMMKKQPQLIYVACSSEALARDGLALVKGGYVLDRVHGVDMFPHTTHLEIAARFIPHQG